ncbi:hypothetical protein IAU60_003899 [Kwoniella sp. DSM 27419]
MSKRPYSPDAGQICSRAIAAPTPTDRDASSSLNSPLLVTPHLDSHFPVTIVDDDKAGSYTSHVDAETYPKVEDVKIEQAIVVDDATLATGGALCQNDSDHNQRDDTVSPAAQAATEPATVLQLQTGELDVSPAAVAENVESGDLRDERPEAVETALIGQGDPVEIIAERFTIQGSNPVAKEADKAVQCANLEEPTVNIPLSKAEVQTSHQDNVSIKQAEDAGDTNGLEDLANRLKSGQASVEDLSAELRLKVFRIIDAQRRAKVVLHGSTAVSNPDPVDSGDSTSLDPHSAGDNAQPVPTEPMKWSSPSMQLGFSRAATNVNLREDRGFRFAPNQSFVCRPVAGIVPDVISLILARQFLVDCDRLDIELIGLEGSGSLSDGYKGVLRARSGSEPGRPVIVKLTSPDAFYYQDHWRFGDRHKAETRILLEARHYTENLSPLQGEVVPIFYGMWEMTDQLFSSDDRYRTVRYRFPLKVYVTVLEDVGPVCHEYESLGRDASKDVK